MCLMTGDHAPWCSWLQSVGVSDVVAYRCHHGRVADLEDLVREMSELLGVPCTLEDADFKLITYSRQVDVDLVRQRSILERRSTAQVREWFQAQGIRESPGPVRTPAEPTLGITARLCIPARHRDRIHGYFWLLDPDQQITERHWPRARKIAEVAAVLLSQSTRHQARHEIFFHELMEGDPAAVRIAARELASASGLGMQDQVTCVLA